MKVEKVTKLLKLLGATVPAAQPRASWLVCDCPLGPWNHDEGKSSPEVFGVRRDSSTDPFCFCFSCGWSGKLSDLVFTMKMKNAKDHHVNLKWQEADALLEEMLEGADLSFDVPDREEMMANRQALQEFPEWWLDTFPKAWFVDWARNYLLDRSVPEEMAEALDIRADTTQMRVCFPVRDFKGLLMGLHGRSVYDNVEPRYRMYNPGGVKNPIVWLGEHWVDLNKPIVTVEGPFDLTSVLRVYQNAVCPLFVNPSEEKLRRMEDAMEWVTLYDNGKGGETGRAKVSKLLGKTHIINHVKPPAGVKDPGLTTTAQLMEILSPFVEINCIFP